jgi:hypothetical protein
LGLATDYKSERETGKCLRNTFGLSFLYLVEAGESCTNDFMSTIPENYVVQEFSDYIIDNSISNDGIVLSHILFGYDFLVKGIKIHDSPSTLILKSHIHHHIQFDHNLIFTRVQFNHYFFSTQVQFDDTPKNPAVLQNKFTF